MRILQINLNRCKLAQDMMHQCAIELRPDIIIISEPNRQLPHWFNDTKGDASIWVTLLNGKLPDETTEVKSEGIVGVRVGDVFCFSGYCSPNISKLAYSKYIDTLSTMTKSVARRHDKVVVAGDFNAKSTCWGGSTTDKRGRVLMEALSAHRVFPLRLKEKYTFFMNGKTSFPDIISVSNKVSEIHAESAVLDKYSASDHLYVLHRFKARKTRTVSKFYRYVTKEMSPEEFLSRFDDTLKKEDLNAAIGADGAESLQKSIEGTCEGMLRKANCAANRKYANYWWNPMIAELRAQTHKALRKVTRERKKNAGNTEPLVNAYKEIRRQLKKEIARSKKTAWAEYCKILESDPWGKPYRTVMKRCNSKGPTSDMPSDMVKAVVQRLFTMGHGPSHYEGREEAETEEKETSASASPSAKAMSSMLPEEWTPKRLQESMACRARSRS